ncbi:MAG: hypothetical protein ACFB00_06895 [Parvularculaceae bacterium]
MLRRTISFATLLGLTGCASLGGGLPSDARALLAETRCPPIARARLSKDFADEAARLNAVTRAGVEDPPEDVSLRAFCVTAFEKVALPQEFYDQNPDVLADERRVCAAYQKQLRRAPDDAQDRFRNAPPTFVGIDDLTTINVALNYRRTCARYLDDPAYRRNNNVFEFDGVLRRGSELPSVAPSTAQPK